MRIVNDKVYLETIKRVKKLINISSNPTKYNKKILINLMPIFAFKQLIIFIRLGEYLKKNNYYVDYFICDGVFNHCDMVKMNDEVDRKLICERCKLANQLFKIPSINKENKNLHNYKKDTFFNNSIYRYCSDEIKFLEYEKETIQNLAIAKNLRLDYDICISLDHFQHYSIAPFIKQFNKNINIAITPNTQNKISLFGSNKNQVLTKKINFNKEKLLKIETFLKNRIKISNLFKIDTNKKIVSIFPNIIQDVFEDENKIIFNSMYEWLIETVDYLLKHNFFVIVKAHPSEKSWNPIKSVIDCFEENENLMLLKSDTTINTYDILNISEFIVVYNGTIFYESIFMDKKVIVGGRIGDLYHKNKDKYFNQFISYKKYDYEKVMEYAYKIMFTFSFKLNMINKNIPYPYIDKNEYNEPFFNAIIDLIEDSYNPEKYIDNFISIY